MSAHTQIVGTHKISQVKQKVNSSISHDHKCLKKKKKKSNKALENQSQKVF